MKTILLADDSHDIRGFFETRLKALNYQVICADNGHQLIQLCETSHPDLIITDYRMPVVDGLRAIKEIKQKPSFKELPFILISSYPFSSSELNNLKIIGMQNFFLKPFESDDILEAVKHIFEKNTSNQSALVNNMRLSRRYETEFFVHIVHPEENKVRVKNISKNGLCVVLNYPIPKGESLTIQLSEELNFMDPEWKKIHTSKATVIWSKPCPKKKGLFLTGLKLS